MFMAHGYLMKPIEVSLNAVYHSLSPVVAFEPFIQQKGATQKQKTTELKRFTRLSVFSRLAFVSGLIGCTCEKSSTFHFEDD